MTEKPAFPSNPADPTQPAQRWSHAPAERTNTDLVVLLHGFGANENDLFPLADSMPERFTTVAVRANKKLPDSWGAEGYCWFPISTSLNANPEDVYHSVINLDAWVAHVADNFRSVSLIGFSQGMAMATSLLRFRPEAFATVIGLSGFVIPTAGHEKLGQHLADGDVQLKAMKPPVFYGRDPRDEVIGQARAAEAEAWLHEHTTVAAKEYHGVGHGVPPQEIQDFTAFLDETVR